MIVEHKDHVLHQWDIETDSLDHIRRLLRTELEARFTGIDYCGNWPTIDYPKPGQANRAAEPIGRYRWLAVYAVTGSNEGHYVHVDRLYSAEKPNRYAQEYAREPLIMIKTFGGYEEACAIAAYVGRRLDV